MGSVRPTTCKLCGVLRDQSGQAVFLLLLLAVSMLFFLSLMYHTGVVIVLRMKLQNSADVSAMAGATVQAQGMELIARLNEKIVQEFEYATEDMFTDQEFPDHDTAVAYFEEKYLPEIDKWVRQIEQVQFQFPDRVRAAARDVALRNVSQAQFVWHTPRLTQRGPSGSDAPVLVKLRNRKDGEVHYVLDQGGKLKHRKFRAPAYFDGKTNEVVYSAVELRLQGLPLGDSLFQSRVDTLVAYAAAKPWRGALGGYDPVIPLIDYKVYTRLGLILHGEDPIAEVKQRTWSRRIYDPFHDPRDYDAWLVSIGDPRLKPAPESIPNHQRFVH
jgi:hypothetical protein